MTDLYKLRFHYRQQHAAMHTPSEKRAAAIMHTNRRQAACRPRGGVYVRMLMLEIYEGMSIHYLNY
jgi:hypothetical protein